MLNTTTNAPTSATHPARPHIHAGTRVDARCWISLVRHDGMMICSTHPVAVIARATAIAVVMVSAPVSTTPELRRLDVDPRIDD